MDGKPPKHVIHQYIVLTQQDINQQKYIVFEQQYIVFTQKSA
jgi:hypothetical protein